MMIHKLLPILAVCCLPATANDALDLLEGNKRVEDVELPPLSEEEEAAEAEKPAVFEPMEWPPSPLDPVWDRAILLDHPDHPWLQQLAVTGLYEWNGSWGSAKIDGGADRDLDTTRTRRARLGARMKIFGNTEIAAVGEFAGDARHRRLETLKGETEVHPGYFVEYGKYRPRFGIEQSKDPAEWLTPHRALLANMLMPASTLGVGIGHERGPWSGGLGWFSGAADRYFPGVSGNGVIAANLAYETAERLEDGEVMRSRWHLDYLMNLDRDESRSIPRFHPTGRRSANGAQAIGPRPGDRHLVSTGVELEGERFAFEGDFQFGHGDNLTAWGMTLAPSYWIMPGRLRMVGRYHYADTDDALGLVGGLGAGADPFFDASPVFAGDEFHSFYLGANVSLYRDKMVLLNGLEYALMKDDAGGGFETDAWIWHTGARVSF
jgi:hypothetical protein